MSSRKFRGDFDPFQILVPVAIPVVPGGMPQNFPFFRPTLGPGTGPGSGGTSIRALVQPRLGPVQGLPNPS